MCTCSWLQEHECILKALAGLADFLQKRADIWPRSFGNITDYITRVLSLQVCDNIAQVRIALLASGLLVWQHASCMARRQAR